MRIFRGKKILMVRIFAKIMVNERIKKSFKYTRDDEDFEIDNFFEYVKDICETFDSPTPVILAKHIRDYIVFNTATFKPDDFVEKVYFDKLVIETYKGI